MSVSATLCLRLVRSIGLAAGLLALTSSAALAAPPAKPRPGAQKKAKGTKTHAAPAKGAAAKAAPARHAGHAGGHPQAPGDAGGHPQTPGAKAEPAAEPITLALDLHRATLDNGLRVIVDVDHGSPTVAIAVVHDAGVRDEERGQSGLSRLCERLMFEGSRNVLAGDHARLIAGRGGEVAAATSADRAVFSEALPAGDLALGLWLEADRLRGLAPSQAGFDGLRRTLQDEQRARAAGAYQASRARLEALVYQGYWPYEHAGLDLDAVDLAAAQAFHDRHHAPASAVLVVAGDVDAEAAMALVHRYFDDVPRAHAAPFTDPGLPEQTSQRTAVIQDEAARAPAVHYGWAVSPSQRLDHQAIDLAGDILAGGEGSRLHRLLVRERALATSVSAGAEQRRGPDLFRLEAVLAGGAKAAEVERLIEAEIKALATRGPTDAEVARARRRYEAAFLLGLQSNQDRARRLGEHELRFGDARLLPADLPRALAISGAAIQRAVAEHLGPMRRTLVETVPPGSAPAAPAEAAPPPPVKAAPAHAAPPAKASKKGAARPRKKKP